MPTIKIHLDDEEFAPIHRIASTLKVTLEDVAYAALNRMMQHCREDDVLKDIGQTREWRGSCLPEWSDSARSVHAYECMGDGHSSPRR